MRLFDCPQSKSPFSHLVAVSAASWSGVDPHRVASDASTQGRAELWETEPQITHVPFGAEDQSGDPVDSSLFEHHDGEPGFSNPRHADDEPVGREIFRVVEKRDFFSIGGSAEIERAELLEILHGVRFRKLSGNAKAD